MYYRRRALLVLAAIAGGMLCAGVLVNRNVPKPAKPLTFPYAVDSAILLEEMVGYEGAFVEYGDEEVVDVAALIVKNTSVETIENATIQLQFEGGKFTFLLSYLPPGEAAMVLDLNAQIWTLQPIFSCQAEYTVGANESKGLLIQQMEDDVLAVTNVSDDPVENIRVYHKNWVKEANLFLGGIAYETQVGSLQPGQFIFLKPHHYITGISQIVAVKRD